MNHVRQVLFDVLESEHATIFIFILVCTSSGNIFKSHSLEIGHTVGARRSNELQRLAMDSFKRTIISLIHSSS